MVVTLTLQLAPSSLNNQSVGDVFAALVSASSQLMDGPAEISLARSALFQLQLSPALLQSMSADAAFVTILQGATQGLCGSFTDPDCVVSWAVQRRRQLQVSIVKPLSVQETFNEATIASAGSLSAMSTAIEQAGFGMVQVDSSAVTGLVVTLLTTQVVTSSSGGLGFPLDQLVSTIATSLGVNESAIQAQWSAVYPPFPPPASPPEAEDRYKYFSLYLIMALLGSAVVVCVAVKLWKRGTRARVDRIHPTSSEESVRTTPKGSSDSAHADDSAGALGFCSRITPRFSKEQSSTPAASHEEASHSRKVVDDEFERTMALKLQLALQRKVALRKLQGKIEEREAMEKQFRAAQLLQASTRRRSAAHKTKELQAQRRIARAVSRRQANRPPSPRLSITDL